MLCLRQLRRLLASGKIGVLPFPDLQVGVLLRWLRVTGFAFTVNRRSRKQRVVRPERSRRPDVRFGVDCSLFFVQLGVFSQSHVPVLALVARRHPNFPIPRCLFAVLQPAQIDLGPG